MSYGKHQQLARHPTSGNNWLANLITMITIPFLAVASTCAEVPWCVRWAGAGVVVREPVCREVKRRVYKTREPERLGNSRSVSKRERSDTVQALDPARFLDANFAVGSGRKAGGQ